MLGVAEVKMLFFSLKILEWKSKMKPWYKNRILETENKEILVNIVNHLEKKVFLNKFFGKQKLALTYILDKNVSASLTQ